MLTYDSSSVTTNSGINGIDEQEENHLPEPPPSPDFPCTGLCAYKGDESIGNDFWEPPGPGLTSCYSCQQKKK